MLLQLALDFVTIDEALELIARTKEAVDLFEVGTPLLLREGAGAVRKIRAAHPGIRILADGKIADGGYGEAKLLFEAGADLVTVLAAAAEQTVEAVQRAAKEHGGAVAADAILSPDPAAELPKLRKAGIDLLCVHRAADSGSWRGENNAALEAIAKAARSAPPLRIMVAGGISLETVHSILPLEPDIVAVGGSIVNAADPAQAARELHAALQAASPGGPIGGAVTTLAELRDRAVDELRRVLLLLDEGGASRMAEELLRAGRVFVAGAGRSGLAARAYAMRLMHLGLAVHVVGDVTTPAIREGDLLVAASGSGRTRGIVEVAESARRVGARIACLTSDLGSPLASIADCCVLLPASTPKAPPKSGEGKIESSQPLGSLFEQSLWLFGDIHITMLKERLGETEESLFRRHANLE